MGAQGSLWTRVASVMVALMFVGTALSALALAVPAVSASAPVDAIEAGAPAAEPLAYVNSAPIRVNDSTELAAAADSGSGTWDDPYMISGKRIDAEGGSWGIYIGNITDVDFVIEDCHITNVTGPSSISDYRGAAVSLYNIKVSGSIIFTATSGVVRDCVISECTYGVKMNEADWCYLHDNEISDTTQHGMNIWYSDNNRIFENYIHDIDFGVALYLSHGSRVSRNTITNSTFGINPNQSDNGRFYGNTITNASSFGIWTNGGGNTFAANSLYLNNEAGTTYDPNHIQAYDRYGGNDWTYYYDGYHHGNYWDDMNATFLSTNGTCSTGYEIGGAGGSEDQFPSTFAVNAVPFSIGSLDFITAWYHGFEGNGSADNPYIIDGLTINAQGSSCGLAVVDTDSHYEIRNCSTYNAQDHDGLYYGSGIYLNDTGNVSISGCTATSNTYGCNINEGPGTDIEGCTFDNNKDTGLRINNSGGSIFDFDRVTDCTCNDNGGSYSSYFTARDYEGAGIRVIDSYCIFIEDTECSDNNGYSNYGDVEGKGILIEGSVFIGLSNVTCDFNSAIFRYSTFVIPEPSSGDATAYGIHIVDSTAVSISDSSASNNTASSDHDSGFAFAYGILIDESSSMILSDDRIVGNEASEARAASAQGIRVADTESVDITGCTVEDNCAHATASQSVVYGIRGWYAEDIEITDSTIEGNDADGGTSNRSSGISLVNCVGIDVIGNTVSSNMASESMGIYVSITSTGTLGQTISDNCISGHLGYGIYTHSTDGLIVYGNALIDNNGATSTYNASHVQAYDSTGHSLWNSTDGSMGNYWSDWTSPDMNEDDIVDDPYVLDGGAEDPRPLVREVSRPYTLAGTVNTANISLTWSASNYSLFASPTYQIVRRVDGGLPTQIVRDLVSTEYNDTDVSPGHEYSYYVTATNGFMESFPSDRLVIEIPDENPPVVMITSPVDGADIHSADVNVTWDAWDNESGISYMNVSVDGGDWTTVDVMYHVFADLADGEHTVIVNVTDNYSLHTTDSVTFTVAVPPDVEITSPSDGATVTSADVNVTWDASDGSGIAYMNVSIDGGDWTTVDVDYHEFPGLINGNHTVYVNVTDNDGLYTMDSVTFTVAVPIGINITSPSNDEVLSTLVVNVTWEAWDNGSDVDHYEVLVDNGTYVDVGLSTWFSQEYTAGHHVAHVKVVDVNMNEAVASVGFYAGYDPVVAITSPVDGSTLYLPNVTVAWAIDAVDIVSIDIQVDGGNWTSVPSNATSTTIDVEVGNHTVVVRVTDSLGRQGNASVSFATEDRPSVTILSPTDGALLNTSDVTVTWEGEAEYHGVDHYEVSVDDGTWSNVGLNTTHTFTELGEGSHTVQVKVVCNYGNTATDSVTFSVDTIAPTVTAHAPTGDDVATAATIAVTFSEPMDQATVTIVIAGVAGTVAWSGDTATFTPSAALAVGTSYDVTVNGDDLAGNALDEFTWSFQTGAGTATLTGTVQDADGNAIAGVTVTSGSVSTTTSDNGTFTMELAPGDHTVTLSKDGYDDGSFDVSLEEGETDDVTETMTATASGGDNTLLYAVIAIVVIAAIGGAVFFLRKQGKL